MTAVQTTAAIDATEAPPLPEKPAAILRGSARGLEIVVDGGASIDAICGAVGARLSEAPSFFRGSDVRIRVEDGPLAVGCLARLDEIAAKFELRIVEVLAAKKPAAEAVPQPAPAAAGSAPSAAPEVASTATGSAPIEPAAPEPAPVTVTDVIAHLDAVSLVPEPPALAVEPSAPTITIVDEASAPLAEHPETRIVIGPVRSGVILEHRGHLIIFGDVNPGAEVRAEGSIVVLGRLRGTAHAGIGRTGFILALRLEPQQLRIARSVARASEGDTPGQVPEIAHVTGSTIVVERYTGRLPAGLATAI